MFQAWKIGVCSFASWLIVGTLINVINSIIWSKNDDNIAPVWCDLSKQSKSPISFLRSFLFMCLYDKKLAALTSLQV